MRIIVQFSEETTSALFYRIFSLMGNTRNHVTLMRISHPMWKKKLGTYMLTFGIQSRSEETAHNSHNSAVTSEKNLPAPEVHSNVDFFRLSNAVQQNQQDFQRQIPTMQGIHQNRMLPPWMPFYPPWFPPHPQMQF